MFSVSKVADEGLDNQQRGCYCKHDCQEMLALPGNCLQHCNFSVDWVPAPRVAFWTSTAILGQMGATKFLS